MYIKPKDASEGRSLDWRKKPRRTFTPEQRLAMVLECAQPDVSVAQIAQRNGINANLLFTWRKLHGLGQLVPANKPATLLPVTVAKPAPKRKRAYRRRAKPAGNPAARVAGTIEIELPGARIYLHGTVSESDLASTLRALARK
jgi:transposase